jgi:hypothetical protein
VVASSVNPSVVGQAVTYTATVSASGPGTPTGTVEFFDGVTAISGCTAQSLSATATDTATCKVTYSASGSHTITAKYLGSIAFPASAVSSPLTQVVNKVATTTVVLGLPNPSAVGKTVNLIAGVAPASLAAGFPTGNIEFLNGSTPISACGGAKGEAVGFLGITSCAVTFSATGAYSITAQYLGTSSFLASTSSAAWQIVTKTSCVTLNGCNLSGINLAGANLAGTNLSGANLSSADLAGTNLSGANLSGANLSGANLQHANLTNANFTGSNLSGANLTGATTTGAKFTGANLKGTIL